MATRSERDKQKSSQERYQVILSQLLKDEDNKYCVDCDAKGPRWASWNLGIFLCIRCAGIHRNLGVHITKVKSVNLDSWTSEQIAMVQEMGNSRARAVYEANLPDSFRRPQTDSGLEAFIRGKYEQKKYIAREWIPPQPKVQPVYEAPKKEKRKPKPKSTVQLNAGSASKPSGSSPPPAAAAVARTSQPEPPKPQPAASADLLCLDTPVPDHSISSDPFGDFISSNTAPAGGSTNAQLTTDSNQAQPDSVQNGGNPLAADGLNLFGESAGGENQRKTQKEDILKLYGNASSSQQMFGVPGGMYMPQQPQQQQQQAAMMPNGMMPNQMMHNNMGMMATQQQVNMMMGQMPAGMYMYYQPQQQQQQQQQPNMMMGQMPGMMPQQQAAMMGQVAPQQAMYNTGNMYNMQQQHLQQVQNQMASMNMGMGMQQPVGTMTAVGAGGGGWGTQPMGQTLSGNLWK